MKAVLIPLVLLILGSGGGVAAAMFLFPAASADAAAPEDDHATPVGEEEHQEASPAAPADAHAETSGGDGHGGTVADGPAYVRLNNQFLIPVVEGGDIRAMVVLTLNLEVAPGQDEHVQSYEPRLRDAFLQALFDHANTGGFDGMFTASGNMRSLRNALMAEARVVLGEAITDVLILDIVRQDM